jgi:hypothetical protein
MTQMPTGGYVRHRNRMIQESVFEDLKDTLIACRWMSGTTSHEVFSPEDPSAGPQIITVTSDQVLKLVGKRQDGTTVAEIVPIDYFPESTGNDDREGKSRKTELNTLAMDAGEPQEPQFIELGSNMQEQQYTFTMAFYASSDAVALAVMSDLKDRYAGRIVSDDYLNLYNYNDPAFDESTPPVMRMEIDAFRYTRASEDNVAIWEATLYFAELTLTDIIDPQEVGG